MAFIKNRVAKDFDVIIGIDSSIDGDIKSSGSIRIEGKISGKVISNGDVIIGNEAIVNSDITAQYCEISGTVIGDVKSKSQLRILKSGSLTGDIVVSSFTIEEGGIFQGNCDINPDKKESSSKKDLNNKEKEKDNKKNNSDNKNNKEKNRVARK